MDAGDDASRIETDPPLTRPSIGRAAITVMESAPTDKTWNADELYAELEKRAWLPGGKTPRNTLQATLSRLVQAHKLDRPMPEGG